ncbi:MAG TPA: hypothetical protein PLP48_02265 [Acholeplasmataceae bacterium]|nr:hypothetical protein [Acholeplasmataceae bacterium]
MRKYDIFGKKVSQVKFLYLLIVIFLVAIAGYFGVINLQESRLYELEQQERAIQRQINQLLSTEEPITYQTIDELLPYLPTTFDQYVISTEFLEARNAASFQAFSNYSVNYNTQVASPFSEPMPPQLKYVRISMNITVTEPAKLLDFIEELYAHDRLYYIQQFNVTLTTEGAIAQFIIFTFYHDIETTT